MFLPSLYHSKTYTGGMFCGIGIIFVVFPGIFVVAEILKMSNNAIAILVASIINLLIVFFIGAIVGKLFRRRKG